MNRTVEFSIRFANPYRKTEKFGSYPAAIRRSSQLVKDEVPHTVWVGHHYSIVGER